MVKKIAVAALVFCVSAVLFGCGGSQQSNSAASSSAASSSASSASSASSEASSSAESSSASSESAQQEGIPNPWHEAATAEEAGQGAFGDTFVVPEKLPVGEVVWMAPTFSYMEDLAQADYEAGAVQACVRKGKARSGIMLHGVYDEFKLTWTTDVNGMEVTCNGNDEGIANLIEWCSDGYGFSVYMIGLGGENYGVTDADLAALVESIK